MLEIVGSNIQSTYITCPADPGATLGIKLPFLVMIVKNVKKYFTFEIQVLDDKNVRRRFRASNFQVCKFALICDVCHFPDLFSYFLVSFPREVVGYVLQVSLVHCCDKRNYILNFSSSQRNNKEIWSEFKNLLLVMWSAGIVGFINMAARSCTWPCGYSFSLINHWTGEGIV